MKKLTLLTLTLALIGCKKQPYAPPKETKEETQARYTKMLACKPDEPLSKGELYEKAMISYWKYNTNSAFSADYAAYETEMEKPKLYRNELAGNEYQIKCGLTYHTDGTPDKVTKDVCYPYQVYQFDNLRDFYFVDDKDFKNKNINDFIINNKAQVYRWDKQPPIYKAENYHKDVDFMVRHQTYYLDIYPTDCCKLLSYDEVLQRNKSSTYAYRWHEESVPIEMLQQNNFLLIKKLYNIITQPPYKESYSIYPVTHCGDILTYKFFT